jgi:Ca-activated chloride channel family protein
MSVSFDYYLILGVDRNAPLDAIRQAFETLQNSFALEERNPTQNPAYQRLVTAYEVLSNPARRSVYDSLIVETTLVDLDIQITISRSRIALSANEQRLYVLINILPPKQTNANQRPLNLTLVIDRSTSMQGRRINAVKSAVELVIDKLTSQDILSIVTFSDRAQVVAPANYVTNKTAVKSTLRNIETSGGTEIYQGLKAGIQELRQFDLNSFTNHLILLTDGHTYGDAPDCLQIAQQSAREGIGITAFGIGSDWNDQFLDQLVAPSSGQSAYIETADQVIVALQKKIQGLGTVYAQNMRLLATFPNEIHLLNGFKISPFAQPLETDIEEIKLGNIEARAPLSVLLEVNINPQTAERRFTVPLELIADIPAKQMQSQSFKKNFQLQVLKNAQQEAPPETIVEAVRSFNMYRMNEKIWEDVEAGNIDMATRRMHHLTTRLLESGESQLAQQAHQELDRIAQAGAMSPEGRKKLKFGTRALINQTKHMKNDDD